MCPAMVQAGYPTSIFVLSGGEFDEMERNGTKVLPYHEFGTPVPSQV